MVKQDDSICSRCSLVQLTKIFPDNIDIDLNKIKLIIIFPYYNQYNTTDVAYIDSWLLSLGLSKEEYYKTTAIKCNFYLKNKEPDTIAMTCCKNYLEKELSLFNENILIVAVGKVALRQVIRGNLSLDAVAGSIMVRPDNKRVFTLYYPNFTKKSTYIQNKFIMHAKSIINLLEGHSTEEKIYYEVILNNQDLKNNIQLPSINDPLALDIETTGLLLTSDILTIALGTDEKIWVIDCTKISKNDLIAFLKKLEGYKLICHNAEFDLKLLNYAYDLNLTCWVDTLQLEHVLDEEAVLLDLQNVLKRYFVVEFHKDVIKFWNYTNDNLFNLFHSYEYEWIKQRSSIYLYNVKDVYWTYKLMKCQLQKLDKFSSTFYFNFTLPLINSVILMGKYGIPIDVNKLIEIESNLIRDIEEKQKVLTQKIGPINFRSSQQLINAFQKLGVIDSNVKRTEKGAISLDKESLESLSKLNNVIGEVASLILEIRTLEKLKTTYISQIQTYIYENKYTKCNSVLSSFKIHASRTYRCNSENINIHNIPRESIIKKMFVAPKNYKFLGFDYQSAEAFHAAMLSGEKKIIDFVLDPTKDQHKYTASFIFKKPEEEITKEERTMAKLGWFCLQYGGTEHALMRDFKMSLEEALTVVKGIKNAYPKLFGFMDSVVQMAKNNKILINRFGACRRFPVWNVSSDKHAMNYLIQSEVSIYTHLAAIDLVKISKVVGFQKFRVLYTIHDAIYSICHYRLVSLICALKKKIMELNRNNMYLLTDPEIGENWYDLYELKKDESLYEEYKNYLQMDIYTLLKILRYDSPI